VAGAGARAARQEWPGAAWAGGRGVGGRGSCAAVGLRRLAAGGRPRCGVLFGPAAPCSVARHCRAKIGGAAEPCHVNDRDSGRRHVSPLMRHHTWRDIDIWPRHDNRRGQKY